MSITCHSKLNNISKLNLQTSVFCAMQQRGQKSCTHLHNLLTKPSFFFHFCFPFFFFFFCLNIKFILSFMLVLAVAKNILNLQLKILFKCSSKSHLSLQKKKLFKYSSKAHYSNKKKTIFKRKRNKPKESKVQKRLG